jgi:hypothetical protein
MTNDDIDDMIDAWHDSGPEEKRSLHEYLGMTWEEYCYHSETSKIPQSWLDRLKETE